MKLPTLYKKTATGAIQSWIIETCDNILTVTYGQVGGKQQETQEVIQSGKNIGRANETTSTQQAEAEALAKWTKQKARKGYVEEVDRAYTEDTDQHGVSPMLAHKFSDYGDRLVYTNPPTQPWSLIYVQPKLDGIRCLAVISDGVCQLYSRTQKLITGVPHINSSLEKEFPNQNLVLDGELYNHGFRKDFEKIVSFVRSETPKPGHEIVEYHVYDLASHPGPFFARTSDLSRLLDPRGFSGPGIVLVETNRASSEDDLMTEFHRLLEEGYEGAIVRTGSGLYVGKRSKDLLKLKTMEDAEFEIVGVTEGRGKMAGLAIFTCMTNKSKEFSVKMKGSLDSLAKYLHDEDTWKGKLLTVQYQNLTADGLPRFPVGLRIREAE